MKILALAQNPDLYSHQRLKGVAIARGHAFDIVPTLSCYMSVASGDPQVFFNGKQLVGYDAVIPRIGISITFYGLTVLRQFEMRGVYPLNESEGIGRSRDQFRSLQLMSRDGLKVPVTMFAHDARVSRQVVEAAGGAPLLIKLLEDTQGVRVVHADTDRSAQSVIEAFRRAKVNILVQQVVRDTNAVGIRALVLGNKVVAATTRSIAEESGAEIASHREPAAIDITEAESSAAIQAAKTVGLNLCGVDLVRCEGGPLVLEVTSSPGLEDIEKTLGIDAASMIIEFLEEKIA
ncbi:MAG: RimK family alpha-L-glutamate ligase [Burkholderiaceae bacterium]